MKKRILFILPRLHTNILPLLRELEAREIKTKALTFFSYKGKHSEDHDNINLDVIGFSKITKLLPKSQKVRFGFPSLLIFKKIKEFNPDVVIVREFLPSAAIIHMYCVINRIPTVMYTQKPLYGWNPSLIRTAYQNLLFPKDVYTTSLGNVEKINTETQQENIKSKWAYVPFVMKEKDEAKNREYFLNDQINILLVAKFTRRKKILEFLEVYNQIYAKNKEVHLTIAGTILEEEVYREVRLYIKKNTLPVTIKIAVPPQNMTDLYLKNDVFVLPSINEPASVSQLEAMAHGLAAICSNDNGTAYYIKPKINGEIFDAKNYHEDLKEKLLWVINDKSNLIKLGNASYQIVKENYRVDNFISYIQKVLQT